MGEKKGRLAAFRRKEPSDTACPLYAKSKHAVFLFVFGGSHVSSNHGRFLLIILAGNKLKCCAAPIREDRP
jgi:hypothetical protein